MSTPIDPDAYQLWPLVVIIIDGYDPRTARVVTDMVAGLDPITLSAMWACHGFAAEQDAIGRQN